MVLKREMAVDHRFDVIVVGGGPAGCAAAAAAGREGSNVLLVEGTGSLGGMGTGGLVPAWCPFSDKKQQIIRGIGGRVLAEARKGVPHEPAGKLDWVAIHPEHLKRVYDDLVTEFGVTVLFHTQLAAVETEGGRVAQVVLCNKAGLTAYGARVYVDATGDGDLATWAGAEFHKGAEGTGDMQPATPCFALNNVDAGAYRGGPNLHGGNPGSPIHGILASGRYPLIPDGHFCQNLSGPSTVGFNAGHLWGVDNTDPFSVSKAMIQGRKMAWEYLGALRAELPGTFGKADMGLTGNLMGVRETRRIVGDYILTVADYAARKSFDDEVARNAYYIDVHLSVAEEALSRKGQLDDEKRTSRYAPGESHGIPYRCLTPKGLANVLVAGRSISCERMVQGSVRVMPVCLATGEAAGMAASHGAAAGGDVHTVDTARLRARLKEEGAYLP